MDNFQRDLGRPTPAAAAARNMEKTFSKKGRGKG